MTNYWTITCNYLKFKHLVGGATLLAVCAAWGESGLAKRAPANYLPDDDVIVRPINNEVGFYQRYVAQDKSIEVIQSRNQIQIWQNNQAFAEQYGYDSTGTGSAYYVPTAEEKWEYFKDRYMRYLKRQGEQPFKDMPKDWYADFRESQRVDTIDELEAGFKRTQKKSHTGKVLPKEFQAKEVSFWKENKFVFQPRLDQGLVIVGLRGKFIDARAWVGVNGKTEINIKKEIEEIGFRAMFNYELDNGEYFTSIDQTITEHLKARFIASKKPDRKEKDEQIMLLYARTF